MTFIPDLSPCTYFDRFGNHKWSTHLTAVGWLEPWEPTTLGPVSPQFRRKLAALCRDPWRPMFFLGFHYCGSCVKRAEGWWVDQPRLSGDYANDSRNVFVPGDTTIYAAPCLIEHYIDHHHYQPPDVFCEAVLRCPRMYSREYFELLALRAGPLAREWEIDGVRGRSKARGVVHHHLRPFYVRCRLLWRRYVEWVG